MLKAQHRETGFVYAIKKFKEFDSVYVSEKLGQAVFREVQILNLLKPHDNIVTLHEVIKQDKQILLVFELLNRTILDELQLNRKLDLIEAKKIIYQLLRACAHMHSKNVVHRDVKPENMLLSKNGVLKVCDLGSAKFCTPGQQMSEYVCTRWYRAPEILVGYNQYGTGIDVWAIGCIFVELLTGKALFGGKNDIDMLRLILRMFHGSEELP